MLALPLTLTWTFDELSMAALLLPNETRQISIVDAMVAKSITRELARTTTALRRNAGWPPWTPRIATRAKTVRPEAAKREKRVARSTERTRHKFFLVGPLRHNKSTPVTA